VAIGIWTGDGFRDLVFGGGPGRGAGCSSCLGQPCRPEPWPGRRPDAGGHKLLRRQKLRDPLDGARVGAVDSNGANGGTDLVPGAGRAPARRSGLAWARTGTLGRR